MRLSYRESRLNQRAVCRFWMLVSIRERLGRFGGKVAGYMFASTKPFNVSVRLGALTQKRISLGGAGVSILALMLSAQAMAQTAPSSSSMPPAPIQLSQAQVERIEKDRNLASQEVAERQQPEYAPLGIRLGAFMINPGIEVTGNYTDNLYATTNNEKSDYFLTVNPSVFVQSNWSLHQLEFWASGKTIRYKEYEDESVNNFDVFTRGKFDIARGSWVSLKPYYILDHEKRGSPDTSTGALEPTQIATKGLDFNAEYKPARLWFKADATIRDFTFDNSQLGSGGFINNADRDRTEIFGGLRAGYELIPGYSAFVEARANDRKYDSAIDDLGFRRDSSGYEARIGAELELTGKLKGDIFAGYMWQDYTDARFVNLSAPVFGASLTWNATGLTTVKLKVARTVEETTINRAAGNLQNSFEVNVDHELQRNIILSANGKYSQQDYRGTTRDDDTYEASLKANYRLNRIYKLSGGYTYSSRSSNAVSSDYTSNTISAGVTALF